MKIIRVFPRRTNATPDDANVRINALPSPLSDADNADAVHISVTFSWDLPLAEFLYKQWRHVAPCTIGGPATGQRGEEFVPGMYLKKGYVITSRGCNNNCWFCYVPKREGKLRELPITEGHIVTDNNLLACSDAHIKTVFAMLSKQKEKPQFTGGLEARLLKKWHAESLLELKPASMYFAYDTPADYEPLVEAGKLLHEVGFKQGNHIARCYVLIGYKGDTIERAEKRLRDTWAAGFMPMAMLYNKYEKGLHSTDWKRFQREWARPQIVGYKLKKVNN
jgi:hypothetical protein